MDENVEPTSGYNKRPLWQWIVLYLIIGVIIYGLIYYFVIAKRGGYNQTGQYQQTNYPTTANISPSEVMQASPSSAMAAKEVTIIGTEFSFTPSTISAKVGDPLKITFKNEGKLPHNLTISALNEMTKTILPGQEETIEFTPNKAGTYPFICTVPGHADRGMRGTLIIQ